ncbi:MAG: endonuclease III [Nitrospira sp.]|nr:endonuclease III [Nitrospira sp.]
MKTQPSETSKWKSAIHNQQSTTTRARRILKRLRTQGTNAPVELSYTNPFELLVATILSAQCTDERVNRVTPGLFAAYPGARELAGASQAKLEALIKPTGFYRNKAQHLVKCSQALVSQFHGAVPKTMEDLTSLPGIGRKTANVILGACFHVPAIVVDTHVKRVAQRLHLTRNTDPAKIEFDLQAVWPARDWTDGSQRMLLHGRYVCLARKPQCSGCVLYEDCPWEGKGARLC